LGGEYGGGCGVSSSYSVQLEESSSFNLKQKHSPTARLLVVWVGAQIFLGSHITHSQVVMQEENEVGV